MTDEAAVITDEAMEDIRNLPAVVASEAMVARAEVSVEDVVAQRDKIQQVMEAVMKEGVHYGKIPGISKPSLFKPGAEVLCTTFRFSPSYERQLIWGEGHLTTISDCALTHAPSGIVLGTGGGVCSTRESKYAYRNGSKTCLECGEPLRKSKNANEYYCWSNPAKGANGCGAKFPLDHPSIEAQVIGRIDNPDVPDTYNTVLKMADKRALVAAILVCTAASDLFTQDVEDAGTIAADTRETSNEGSANGNPLQKMHLDIEDLFRAIDKKRKCGPGGTFAEFETVVKTTYGDVDWKTLDEDSTIALGTQLGGYFAYLGTVAKDDAKTFSEWVDQDTVPF